MSVNDDLPWIPHTLEFIEQAFKHDVPAIGHCVGVQLMSKALGTCVKKRPVGEIGWGALHVDENSYEKKYFGNKKQFLGFHWHGDAFELLSGAKRLLFRVYCDIQAYAIGKHLAMPCHLEMTYELVRNRYKY